MHIIVKTTARHSAIAVEIQIPSIPSISGNISTAAA